MKNVLAITVALVIAAIVLTPVMGYTNQAAGNQSYTAKSGSSVDSGFKYGTFSFTSLGVPAHNLTPVMVANKYSFKSSAVQSSRIPYSFRQEAATAYSIKVEGVENAVSTDMKKVKNAALLGSMSKNAPAVEAPVTEAAPIETPVAEPVVAEPVVVEPVAEVPPVKFTIEGTVFEDMDGNGIMDATDAGLANWTVNLEQPAGNVINSAITGTDGKFAFMDLAAGEYAISEVIQMGWNLISPAEGKLTVNIIDQSATNLVFANQVAPAAPENVTAA